MERISGIVSKLAAIVAASWKALKESFLVFWGIDEDDKGSEKAEKIAKTVSKGLAYYFSDYALTMLSPATVAFLKWLGWGDFAIALVMWVEDTAIAYSLVLFSRHVVDDFTLTESLRESVEVIWKRNKTTGLILSGLILLRFSVWDGPERIVIFFHKELAGKKAKEFLILVAFSAVQAIFWTKFYSLAIDGLVGMWRVLF